MPWATLRQHFGRHFGPPLGRTFPVTLVVRAELEKSKTFGTKVAERRRKKRFLVEAEKTGKLQVVLKIETAKLEQKKKIVVRVLILTTHKQLLFDLLQIKL